MAACVKWAVYNTPPGSTTDFTAIVATCASICGVPYTYQLYTNVMARVFPVGGAAGAAGGISIWWVIPGIIVGTIIGGVTGEGIDWAISEDTPPSTLPAEGCQVLSPSPNPNRQISGSHWGCTNSESEVVNAAHARCSATTTCSGACSSGKPCAPYASIYDIVQIPGLFSCDTTVYYKCACGCG